jgi:hypothetical protein
MADSDLLFSRLPATSGDLVFGETDSDAGSGDHSVSIAAELPALRMRARVAPVSRATLVAALPGLRFAATVAYDSRVQRPTVSRTRAEWKPAGAVRTGVEANHQNSARLEASERPRWQPAVPVGSQVEVALRKTLVAARATARTTFAGALPVGTHPIRDHFAGMIHLPRPHWAARHQDAVRVRVPSTASPWSETLRDRRQGVTARASQAVRSPRGLQTIAGRALPLELGYGGRYQDAMRPPAGTSKPPVVPPVKPPCYTPDPHLVFRDGPGGADLLFVCERSPDMPAATVVVPVRSFYMVFNDVSLVRVDGCLDLPALSLSLKIDADSWTWGFDASLPAASLPYLDPDGSTPVELEARVNGKAYRLIVERIARERQFGRATVSISGRGRSALLDAPYAPTLNFSSSADRTAQQLMLEALTANGASIGWDLDWQLADWVVPGGVWAHQGSYIDALNTIAAAAGGYLQPHASDDVLRVLHRYPTAPWEWDSVAPDFELPADVTTRESVEWTTKPDYNGIYVSGVSAGVLGFVKRSGTPGDLLASMVTDALITHADAARQRGRTVLSDTGRQALVTLRLPVLPETGVIEPGRFVRYVDGDEMRVGLVRSTGLDCALPDVWQTIGVETHA